MSPSDLTPEQERKLLVSHEGLSRVEEVDGRRVIRFSVPPGMHGHTFSIELSGFPEERDPEGPFRFEYVLGSEFAIYESELPRDGFEIGYSHLKVAEGLESATVALQYTDSKAPDVKRNATLRFQVVDGMLRRLVLDSDEVELSPAVRRLGQIVADLLDSLSLRKGLPISIRHIDISAPGKKFHRRYVTLPYGQHSISEEDFTAAQQLPPQLRGAVRLFREGISSSRPPYRLLCLYRIREVVEAVRRETDRATG